MKRAIALSLILFAAIACMISSCNRKENVETIVTRLLRTWKLTKIATDDDGSGSIETSEIHPVSNGADDRITFNKDYSGVQVVVAANGLRNEYPFTWSINAKDTITRIGVGNNTIKYHIDNISSTNLSLITVTDKNILAAYYYDRE